MAFKDILFILAGISIFAGILLLINQAEKRRNSAWKAIAKKLNLPYEEDHGDNLLSLAAFNKWAYKSLKLFQ